ncbi:MAG: serine hydrolase domain-containing protein [Nocardioidaceae bacterium]
MARRSANRVRTGPVAVTLVLTLMTMASLIGCTDHPPAASPNPTTWPAAGTGAFSEGVQRALEQAIEVHAYVGEATGLTAAVVTPDGTWVGAAGVDGTGEELQPESAMLIASVTKTFVGAEVLLLASRGEVDLDAPVSRYVDLPFDTGGATVRQAATMTSAFPNLPRWLPRYVARHPQQELTADDLIRMSRHQPRAGILGHPGNYNGLNFVILGQLIEQVTGQPLATVLRRDLLVPSGADRLWLQIDERPEPPLAYPASPRPLGIVDTASGFLPSLAGASSGQGGAGMAGDALSLARWGYALYGGRVIPADLVDTMTAGDPRAELGYGFATATATINGAAVVGHPGDWMGYTSVLLVWPETRTSIALLVPSRGDDTDPSHVAWVASLYLGFQSALARDS